MRRLAAISRLRSLLDQVFVSGGNFLTIAICAHVLPLSEQGKFTYAFASYMALLLINIAGIFQGAAVRAPTQDASYKILLARLQVLQASLLSLLVCAVWFWAGDMFGWKVSSVEAILFFGFLMTQQLADFTRRIAYIFFTVNQATYSSAMLYPLRIAMLLFFQPHSMSEVLIVLIVSAIFPAIPAFLVASQRGLSSSWAVATEHFIFSRLFLLGAPLGWLWSYIPIFLLGSIHGKEQAAVLASIRGISNIANVLMEQIETQAVAEWARTYHRNGSYQIDIAIRRLVRVGGIFWLCGMLGVAIFGQEIVTIVLGQVYAPHWRLLMIGWGGYGVYFLVRVMGLKHRTFGATHVEFMGGLWAVFAALFAGLLLIPRLSVLGAAWVYVIIPLAMLVGQLWSLKNRKNMKNE